MNCICRILREKEKQELPIIVEISPEARKKHLEKKARKLAAEILEKERQKEHG